jgi:hypothetical protein
MGIVAVVVGIVPDRGEGDRFATNATGAGSMPGGHGLAYRVTSILARTNSNS